MSQELTVTKGDMKIIGSPNAIAELLISIDNIYVEHERELRIDNSREQRLLASPEESVTFYKGVGEAMITPKGKLSYQTLYKEKRAELDKRNNQYAKTKYQYPKPKEIAMSYIDKFGKDYQRQWAIDFIKNYIKGHRLTNQYRRRVLISIINIVNNTGARFHQKKNSNHNGERKKRQWIRRDWNALAIEYLNLELQPSINKFLISKGIFSGGNHNSFKRELDRIKQVIIGNRPLIKPQEPIIFSTSKTSSIG